MTISIVMWMIFVPWQFHPTTTGPLVCVAIPRSLWRAVLPPTADHLSMEAPHTQILIGAEGWDHFLTPADDVMSSKCSRPMHVLKSI